jgi:GTP-binding protein EngB required for normal cell division
MSDASQTRLHVLNENQQRRLRVTCQYIDKLLSEIEVVLSTASSKAAFPRIASDISPAQRRTIEDYITRLRAQLVRVLDGQGIPREGQKIPASRALRANLTAIDIAVEELSPSYMRGCGPLAEGVATELNGIVGELESLVSQLDRYLVQSSTGDLRDRLQRLEQTADETQLLAKIEKVVSERGLVEFRSTITNILERLEDQSFEIAVFGRVSSGKSSLLNAMLDLDVLPVGVTPITAVPTRVRFGEKPKITVWFAERPTEHHEVAKLAEYVTEQKNPANRKNVSRVLVQLSSPRLRDGVTFVDTPGLGSLATSGAAETLAYLPKCDLGVVLIDAASTLTPDDLKTVQTLQDAAIPTNVLLSKADLLAPPELERVIAYVKEHLASECRLDSVVHPVSVLPTHRGLLDEWFNHQIDTLFAHSRELKTASLKRKIGALRESVIAALQTRLRRTKGLSASQREEIRNIEARLRRVTGHIEEARTFCENESEKLYNEYSAAIQEAARLLLASESSEKGNSDAQARIVFGSMRAYVQVRVKSIHERLQSLAGEFADEFRVAAQALDLADAPGQEEFEELLRDSPVFELKETQFQVSMSFGASLFGQAHKEKHLAAQLSRQIGSDVDQAVKTYSGLLENWAVRALAQLKRRFDSYADTYRAQADRLIGGAQLSGSEESAILQDLIVLGASPTSAEESGAQPRNAQLPKQLASARSDKP